MVHSLLNGSNHLQGESVPHRWASHPPARWPDLSVWFAVWKQHSEQGSDHSEPAHDSQLLPYPWQSIHTGVKKLYPRLFKTATTPYRGVLTLVSWGMSSSLCLEGAVCADRAPGGATGEASLSTKLRRMATSVERSISVVCFCYTTKDSISVWYPLIALASISQSLLWCVGLKQSDTE